MAAVVAMPARAEISPLEAVVSRARAARFVAIGERHDNPAHHRNQAEIVAALEPVGLALEMVPGAKESLLNRLRREGADRAEIGEALEWGASGWPDWEMYAPILEAAPEAYVACGALSREQIGRIYSDGAAAVDPLLTARYGLDRPLADEERDAMIEEQFLAHCEMMPRDRLGPMVEVQRVWDAAFADAWLRAAQEGGGQSVLICGNGHARLDRGAPAYLRRAREDAAIFSIGQIEDGETGADEPFDAVLSAPAPERDDPCERMRRAMDKSSE